VREKWLTLLVHGVGDHKPGEMIDAVTGAFSSVDHALPDNDEYVAVHLEDKTVSRGWFPMYSRRFDLPEGPELIFGEVFWADLSRIRGSTFELLIGIFRLVFGLRYVSDQAATQPGTAARTLRWALYLAILVARGPLLALFTLGAVFCLPLAAHWIGRVAHVPDQSLVWLTEDRCYLGLGLLVATVSGVMLLPVWSKFHFRAFSFWLLLSSLTVVICCNRPDFLSYLNRIYDDQLANNPVPASYLATVIWLSDWTRDAAFACLGLSLVPLILAVAAATSGQRPGLSAAYQAAAFQLLLWQLVLAPLDIALDWGLASVTSTIGHQFVRGAGFYVGFRILAVYSMAAALLVIWLMRMRWAKRHPVAEWPRRFPPRLIVGLGARVWVVVISIVLILDSMLLALREITDAQHRPYPKIAESFVTILDWPIRQWVVLVWAITIVAACFAILFKRVVRNALHVATDVVNHFYRPDEGFPVRQQIESRFHKVLARLLEEYQPTRIVVIAHSQGTVISFNALSEIYAQAWFQQYAATLRAELVTVGSPLTHLYQHYFPAHYPVNDPKQAVLQPYVRRWRNIFRTDDYIGTFVTLGSNAAATQAAQAQSWPESIPARPGGHTHYWEADIFAHLTDLVR
jgi:hypothetical protein